MIFDPVLKLLWFFHISNKALLRLLKSVVVKV